MPKNLFDCFPFVVQPARRQSVRKRTQNRRRVAAKQPHLFCGEPARAHVSETSGNILIGPQCGPNRAVEL